MKNFTFFVFLTLATLISFSQTGPGGIDSKDGSGDLVLWLIADSAVYNGSNEVTSWPNLAGVSGLSMTSTGISPTFVGDALNGHAEISFTDVVDALESSSVLDADSFPTNSGTILYVLRHDNNSQRSSSYQTGTSSTSGSGANRVGAHNPWNGEVFSDLGNCGCGIDNTGSDGRIVADYEDAWVGQYGIWISRHDTDEKILYRDTVIQGPVATPDPYDAYNQHASNNFYLGHSSNDNFQGDFVEMIVFKRNLNDAEIEILRNYLAARYGLPITNDLYAFNSSHGEEVAGIGQSGADVHNGAFSSFLGIGGASTLGDGDFVLFGHDNGSFDSWVTEDQPLGDSNFVRINREWRFDVTNTPGTTNIAIDTIGLPSKVSDFDYYYLWLDNDGDFTSGATAYPLTLIDSVYQASNVAIGDAQFATIALHRSVLNFSNSTFSVAEASSANFQVEIPYLVYRDITIDFTVDGASTSEDVPVAGTITIDSAQTTGALMVATTDDLDPESDETIILNLDGASISGAVLGDNDQSTAFVNDDDNGENRTIEFLTPCNYGYTRDITIKADSVEGGADLSNYILLVSFNDSTFLQQTEGKVQNVNGYDIRFTYKDSLSFLEHQIERYDGTEGDFIAWVKLPILSATTDTEITMYYGNAAITEDPSTDNVWSEYIAVHHFDDNLTNDGGNATFNASAVSTASYAGGLVGQASSFDGSGNNILEISNTIIPSSGSFSISFWFNPSSAATQGVVFDLLEDRNTIGSGDVADRYFFYDYNGSQQRYWFEDEDDDDMQLTVAQAPVTDDWNLVTLTGRWGSGSHEIYSNDLSEIDITLFEGPLSPNTPFRIGGPNINYVHNNTDFTGLIDEFRVINRQITLAEHTTNLRNQSNPGEFYTLGAESTNQCTLSESVASIDIMVGISNTDNDAATTVSFQVTGGDAEEGTDFTLPGSSPLSIAAGDSLATFTVNITNDLINENNESFTISLFSPTNANLGSNSSFTYTIEDDDAQPVIALADTTVSINEGSTINSAVLTLSSEAGNTITVDYEVTAISATLNDDFVLSDGTLTIEAGVTSQQLNFNVIDDDIIEAQETFAIKFSNAINATLDLAYDSVVFTINDNDNFGIDGPGGVGNVDGSGTLVMWMIADSAATSGSNVTAWENEVGITELNLSPPLTSPTLVPNAKNGHAEISFANVNDVLSTTERLSTAYFPYNEATTFVVTRHDNLVQQSNTYGTSTVQGGGLAGNRFSAHLPWNGQVYFDIGQCCGTDGRSQFVYNTDWVGEYSLFSYTAGSEEGKTVRVNSDQQDFDAGTDIFQNHSDYFFNIGQSQSTNFLGDILEFIMFTNPLNNAQVVIMENYLAAKYDLSISNDLFAFSTTHSFDVVGIGYEDADNFHVAAKANLITLSNASDFGDGDYVFAGHNNELKSSWNTSEIPTGFDSLRRVQREWRFDVTGTPGTVSIAIDSAKLPVKPNGYADYILMVDDDGDFSADATIYSTSLVNGEYVANNVEVSQGAYMTIGVLIRKIDFSSTFSNVLETASGNLTIELNQSYPQDLTIDYVIKSGTASQGTDYSLSNTGSVTIFAGSTSATLNPGVIDESEIESDETLVFALRNAPNATFLGADSVFTYTITDDDNTRDIEFRSITDYGFKKRITINSSQVNADLANFPLYFTITNDSLRSVGNGGTIQNSQGFDIGFTLADSSDWIQHDLETFDPVTGTFVIWIKIPELSSSENTVLDFYYGNDKISFDYSSSSVWDSYQGVYHFNNDVSDASINERNGANNQTTDVGGFFGQGRDFDGSSDFIDLDSDVIPSSGEFTISFWYNPDNVDTDREILFDMGSNTGGKYFFADAASSGLRWWYESNNDADVQASYGTAPAVGDWNFVMLTGGWDDNEHNIYEGGSLRVTNTTTVDGEFTPRNSFRIGACFAEYTQVGNLLDCIEFDGQMDEFRIFAGRRSLEYHQAEFANQNNPTAFYSVSIQDTVEVNKFLESVSSIDVTVSIQPVDNANPTTATYTATGGTAINGQDYTLNSGTVTVPAGSQTGSFSFSLINDLSDEVDETVEITLSNPSSNTKIGGNSTTTFTIEDDDGFPTISFVDTISTANEGSSLVRIPVELNIVSGNIASVDYEVKSATATSGVDFTPLSGTLEIAPGELSNTISFQPIDDADIESVETVEIRLFNPQNAVLSTESDTLHLVRLKDNDDLGFEGPGGVGDVLNASGEKLLKLWLIADEANANGSNQVTSWDNKIQNISVDYTMIPASGSPNLVTNAINGRSVVSFEDTQDALVSTGTLSAASFPGNELSIFIVTETDNLSQVSYAYATDDNEAQVVETNSISASIPNNGNVEFNLAGDIETATYQASWIGNASIFTHVVSSDTFLVRRNNGTIANDNSAGNNFTNQTNFNFYLGKSSSVSDHFQGDIAEVIMFSRELNLAQINIVNNYLAARYDLSITTDLYNFNVTHGNEVAGIGREDVDNQHVAARAGSLTISNASDLGDGDYVLFGHDDADVTAWSSSEIPLDGVLRTQREWRVDTTGTPGTLTIAIDTTLLPNKPVGNEDYIVIVDADGDFTSGATVVSTTLVDNEYKASDIGLNSGDYFTIGIATRTVSFDLVADNGFEDEERNVRVNLSLESQERIDLDYVVTGGTATGGIVDYSLATSGTVSFLAGQTVTNLPLGIINDAILESDETIVITLRNPPAGVILGADSVHTYTINDDDNFRKVQFARDTITNAESVDSVYLIVEVDPIDTGNETTVLMTVTGGTAELSPAPDYTFATDTIKIQPNETRDSLLVVIIDDVLFEDTESLIFSLSGPTNAGLGDTTQLVYQIEDNDTQVVASFQDTTVTVDEGASVASIVVELDNLAGQDIVVNYAVDGTKTTATGGGTDYSIANGSVTIPSGSEFTTINVALTDDDIEEANEIITIGISGDNVLSNQADTVVITIADNDALAGYYGPGGVGNRENNLLWLDAYNVNGRGVANPGELDAVPTWKDNSGNGYVFTATSATEAQQPTWDPDVLNGAYPSVTISNSQFGFEAPDGFTNSLSNYTMMTVGRQFSGNYMLETNTSGNGVFGLNLSTGGLYTFNGVVQSTGNLTTTANLTTWQFNALETNTAEIFRNGTSVFSNSGFNSMSIANNFAIGNRYDGASQATSDFRGRISEVIIYNNPINLAQRIIVENYLAAKYGLTIANDLYDYQGIFYYDVVGIGSTASEGQHLEAMSDSLLLVSNPVALDSGEFVFMGHDNGGKATWTTFEAPLSGSNVRRIEREWRVDIVGDPGNFSFKVDIDQLPTPENGFTQYAIYVDADGDFNDGAEIYQLDFSPTSGLYVTDQLSINEGDYVTIGVLKPVIEFVLIASDSTESFTNPKIEVALNFTRDENVTVGYEATGGTATGANVDYLLSDGTLTIAPGNLLGDIDLGIINDAIFETSETIEITLANPSSNISLGTNVVHTYTINDDDSDRRFEFNTSDLTVAEDAVDQTIQIDLIAELDDSPVVSDGSDYVFVSIQAESTATISLDYDTLGAFVGDTLFVPNGSSSVGFTIDILDDMDFESSETVVLRLSGGNANIGDANQIVLTITDNDTQPTVQFAETEAFGQESVSPVQIDVELSVASGATTTVGYSVSSTNATAGTDFDLTDGTLTFDPGETETSILLTINDDVEQEPGEVVSIALSGPVNATLGTNTTFNYTILDNDNLGSTGPGGVGDNTNNLLWLRADYYDGTTTWLDSSRNNHDATVISTPTLNASNANFNNKPTITFDGTADAFDIDPFTSEESDYDVFLVYETSNTSPQEVFSTQGGLVLGHELGFGYSDDGGNQGTELSGTSAGIYQYSLQSGSGNAIMRIGGSDINTSTYTQTDILANSFIGSSVSASNHFNGDLAEMIFYNSTLNSAQRKIVETYLGERYGITNANDLYDNPGFTDDVAGIGRDNSTSIHTEATSANQLTVKNANSLSSSDATDDGDFMLFGHNNGTTTDWDPTANPGIIRLRREWSFDVDGSPGSITVELDLSAFDTTATRTGFPTLTLLVSSSGDFDTDVDRLYSLSLVSGSIYQANGVVLNDNDVLTLGAVRNVSNGGGTLDFSNVGSWVTGTVPGSGDDVFISGTDSVYLSQDVTVGSITVETGGVLYLNGFKLELDQNCITLNGTGRVNATPGEVEYSRAGDQCVTCLFYDDVTFSSSGRKFMLDSIVVTGDLRIADNVVELDTDGFDIYFGGNWTNQGTFTPDNGLVIINGSGNQSIQATGAGGESFFKVAVNKSGGVVNLNSNVSVADSLHLSSGNMNLQSNDLTLQNTEANHLVGSASGFLQVDGAGELFFNITSGQSYALPIGDNDDYSPSTFVINSLSGSSPAISINLRDSKYPEISTDFSHITRYWIFNDVNVTSITYDWIFTYTDADITGGTEETLEPIKFDGSVVTDLNDFPDYSVNTGSNTITWQNLTSFSSGTAGVEDGGTPLPIELMFFEGTPDQKGNVRLDWATVSETDNDFFTIERSYDGINFSELVEIPGAGNTSDERRYTYLDVRPYVGVSYYRLKQTDFNGEFSYSHIIKLDLAYGIGEEPELSLYPNPTTLAKGIDLSLNRLIPGEMVYLSLISMDGKEVSSYQLEVDQSGRIEYHVDFAEEMTRGSYIMSIQYLRRVDYRRIIIR